jgi:flagellar biosynthesis protein FlhF
MKLRKFFGPTSRSVLEQVRAELGPDAMIVANHASADGIEISALPADALPQLLSGQNGTPLPPAVSLPAREDDDGVTVSLSTHGRGPARKAPDAQANGRAAASAGAPKPAAPTRTAERDAALAREAGTEPPGAATPTSPSPAPVIDAEFGARMMAEMAAMRALFQEQMAQLAWTDALRRSPLRTRLTRDLLLAGYSAQLARTLTERLPDDFNATEAGAWLAAVLSRNLPAIDPADEIVTRGGVYALIGPTGVGKTTTTAKLAARCAVRYGASKLALLTTDSYRVGAQDQLRIYARILGVSVHTVSDRHDLAQALDSVRGRHLVLIDTIGIGQRDSRVAEQAQLLARPDIARVLLLNAAAQAETLDEVVTTYARPVEPGMTALSGAIVTKLDEAARTGAVLDIAIRHRLRLQYVTSGQRVPEDIALPNPRYLVDRSLRAGARPSAFAFAAEELPLMTQPGSHDA